VLHVWVAEVSLSKVHPVCYDRAREKNMSELLARITIDPESDAVPAVHSRSRHRGRGYSGVLAAVGSRETIPGIILISKAPMSTAALTFALIRSSQPEICCPQARLDGQHAMGTQREQAPDIRGSKAMFHPSRFPKREWRPAS